MLRTILLLSSVIISGLKHRQAGCKPPGRDRTQRTSAEDRVAAGTGALRPEQALNDERESQTANKHTSYVGASFRRCLEKSMKKQANPITPRSTRHCREVDNSQAQIGGSCLPRATISIILEAPIESFSSSTRTRCSRLAAMSQGQT